MTNLLAPILLLIAMILPENGVMPLGGILMTVLAPALLIVTQGKVIRMTLIGTIIIPIYLWSATKVAEFITNASIEMGNLPSGFVEGQLFTSIDSNPIIKLVAMLFGQGIGEGSFEKLIGAAVAVVAYAGLFIWYRKQMLKES